LEVTVVNDPRRSSRVMPVMVGVACAIVFPGAAAARDVAGVSVPESTAVEGRSLKLNGAGIRKKLFVKVYVGALYLEAPATSLQQIAGSDASWSVRMYFLRDVARSRVVGAFREGFEKNSSDRVARLLPALDKLAAALPDLQSGKVLVVSYVHGRGTIAGVAGGPTVEIAGKEFGEALLRNWLGGEPADRDLKAAMLSGS
jgi:chalcone isomerase-like protein